MEARLHDSTQVSLDVQEPAHALSTGVCVGTLMKADVQQGLWVRYPGQPGTHPLAARATVTVSPHDVGEEVVLMFENNNRNRPLIVGVLQRQPVQVPEPASDKERQSVIGIAPRGEPIRVNGQAIHLQADRELTLQCGKSSVTLLADGRVYIKGLKIISRARHTHKIKGANVLIN